MPWTRALPAGLRARWVAAGGSWRATGLVLAGAAVLLAAASYIPLSGSVRDDSYRWGYNPIPWLVGGLIFAAATWGLMFGLLTLPRGRHTVADSRRLASEMLVLLISISVFVRLFGWIFL